MDNASRTTLLNVFNSSGYIANTTNNRSNTYEDINHKENISEESKNRGVSFLRK